MYLNESKKFNFKIRPVEDGDRRWVKRFISQGWGSEKIISQGKIYYPHKLPGFVAIRNKKYLGLITYDIKRKKCRIISLNSIIKREGIGRALVEAVKKVARKSNCKKLWLITTNDNISALCFWQKLSFIFKEIYPNAVSLSRKLKPEIPLIGNYGIPIRDEILLELQIK